MTEVGASWLCHARLVADGAGSGLDQGVTTVLSIGALFFGWVAFVRLRRDGYARLPRPLGWLAAAAATACVALVFVLPPILRPAPAAARPSSTARIQIVSPAPGQVFHGSPAPIALDVRVVGGRIVPATSNHLLPNEGHVHVFVDGAIVLMAYGTTGRIWVDPGDHVLQAEFVALDHGPFSPRVLTSVRFRVEP
jgi:hypothetical protein